MFIIIFALIALALTALFTMGSFVFWQAALIFVGCYILVNLVFVFSAFMSCLLVKDMEKPIEKEIPVCRMAAVNVFGLLCNYMGARITLSGGEKLPRDEKYLLVCNHRSGFDPVVIMWCLRRHRVSFIAKPSVMALPFIGRIAYGIGCLGIDRENDRNALKTILTAANYLKKDVCNMSIFPEGTRSRTGEMLPFHAGSFKIAQRAGAPLVIASLDGTESLKKNVLRRFTAVRLNILEVVPAVKVKEMNTQDLAEYSRELIMKSLEDRA